MTLGLKGMGFLDNGSHRWSSLGSLKRAEETQRGAVYQAVHPLMRCLSNVLATMGLAPSGTEPQNIPTPSVPSLNLRSPLSDHPSPHTRTPTSLGHPVLFFSANQRVQIA